MEFIDEMEFDPLGVFYLLRRGHTAASMPDQIDEETKNQREEMR